MRGVLGQAPGPTLDRVPDLGLNKANPKAPDDVLATLYWFLGVDSQRQYVNAAGRPIAVLPGGTPIEELT